MNCYSQSADADDVASRRHVPLVVKGQDDPTVGPALAQLTGTVMEVCTILESILVTLLTYSQH